MSGDDESENYEEGYHDYNMEDNYGIILAN